MALLGRAGNPWEEPRAVLQNPPAAREVSLGAGISLPLGKEHHPDLSPARVLPCFIWAVFVR